MCVWRGRAGEPRVGVSRCPGASGASSARVRRGIWQCVCHGAESPDDGVRLCGERASPPKTAVPTRLPSSARQQLLPALTAPAVGCRHSCRARQVELRQQGGSGSAWATHSVANSYVPAARRLPPSALAASPVRLVWQIAFQAPGALSARRQARAVAFPTQTPSVTRA